MRSVALLCLLLLAPAVHGASFLQDGGDAGRTGFTGDPGPDELDIAFRIDLPGRSAAYDPPLIMDRHVYVLTEGGPDAGLWRVDMDTGLHERLAAAPSGVELNSLASDGERIVWATEDRVVAVGLDGSPHWTVPHPAGEGAAECREAAIADGRLHLLCVREAPDGPGGERITGGNAGEWWIQSMNMADGGNTWTWPPTGSVYQGADVLRLAAVHDRLHIALARPAAPDTGGEPVGWMQLITIHDGADAPEWVVNEPIHPDSVPLDPLDPPGSDPEEFVPEASIAVRGNTLFLNAGDLRAFDARNGDTIWSTATRIDGSTSPLAGGAMALVGDVLYVPAWDHLHAVLVADGRIQWSTHLPPNFGASGNGKLLNAGTHLFLEANQPSGDSLLVIDRVDGAISTSFAKVRIGDTASLLGIGDGVVAIPWQDGGLTVIGQTGASIQVDAALSSDYPAVGGNLVLDLADTVPTAFAEDLEFRIDWGDGSVTEGQDGFRFTHAYAVAGEHEIRVVATNSAGQQTTWRRTVDVGGTPPNFVSNAFHPDNQETTFFVLGFAVTGLFAAIGAIQFRLRRGAMQKQLAQVERIRADGREVHVRLDERRRIARDLLASGKIQESQFSILERAIDDASTRSRLGRLDLELPFLPISLAASLQEMLGDARITDWEHRHFLQALDRDAVLTAGQKSKVRRLVDEWFAQDAA